MQFSAKHIDRHQQVTALQQEFHARYDKLHVKYTALYREMIDFKTKANYWETQFNKFKSREELLKAEIEELLIQISKGVYKGLKVVRPVICPRE